MKKAGVQPRKGAVLVVDNDPAALKLVTANLNQLGFSTLLKETAEEAQELARNEPPAVILLELLLPGMSGFQFLNELRRTVVGRLRPVIVWTVKRLTSDER